MLVQDIVTVRSKGVMEKCNFCFHKIGIAKDKAKDEKRKMTNDEMPTTACQTACGCGAIEYGDLNDPESKVACETLVTTNQTVLAGEVKSNAEINTEKIVRETINNVGYTNPDYKFTGDSCNFNSFIHEQSEDINRGVDKINSKF